MGKRKIIRLTESDLHRIVKEAVDKVTQTRMAVLDNGDVVDVNSLPHKNQYFDLTKFTKEELDYARRRYSLFNLSRGHDHPLRRVLTREQVESDFLAKANYAKSELIKTYPFHEKQFAISDGFNGMYALLLEFDKDDNIETIDKVMESLGFFRSQPTGETLYDLDGQRWKQMRFEPHPSKDLTFYVRENYTYVYHLAPSIFEDSILKNGLIPSNKNSEYRYNEPRVYVMKDNVTNEDIQKLVNTLYLQAKGAGIPNLKPDYSLFKIDVSKIGVNTRIYGDINEDQGLFLTNKIEPNAFVDVNHITVKTSGDIQKDKNNINHE